MKKKSSEKKSNFSLDKYKTHSGDPGSPDQWKEAVRQALLLDPTATPEEIEKKLTGLGMRKIIID